ncbi:MULTISPECIES: hypothetical protein [unclassified Rhizobium]|uniref:hypothetical protein n=1 Tax=unclassified Rhizobium TaxID=2613769 RepID=UPI000700D348|nr:MULTISPECIES: hypothetical protein [unclassified Rhizobium]KQV39181.1 hypothetical protein ASC86_23220 [Rhizobium sp. Root1212]KRD35155.1 hypothetical protein ASE37_21790 [Rhizobium sp. Root268]
MALTPTFGGQLMPWLRNNSDMLLQASAGLLGGSNPQEQMAGMVQGVAAAKRKNRTVEYLRKSEPELAQAIENGDLSGADAYRIYLGKKMEAESPGKLSFETLPDGSFGTFNDKSGQFNSLGTAPKPVTPEKRSFQTLGNGDYGFADPNTGSFTKLGSAPKPLDGAKAPSGYRWADDSQTRLEAIPGGPGTQVPGELAARIGMAENWLTNDLPTIRKGVTDGDSTGWYDRAQASYGVGKPGELERKFQSGVEVLSRLLSGAGMTQVEIDEKAARYMPSKFDTPDSLQTKINQLEAEIRAAGNAAMRGRGSLPPSAGGNDLDALVNKYGGM